MNSFHPAGRGPLRAISPVLHEPFCTGLQQGRNRTAQRRQISFLRGWPVTAVSLPRRAVAPRGPGLKGVFAMRRQIVGAFFAAVAAGGAALLTGGLPGRPPPTRRRRGHTPPRTRHRHIQPGWVHSQVAGPIQFVGTTVKVPRPGPTSSYAKVVPGKPRSPGDPGPQARRGSGFARLGRGCGALWHGRWRVLASLRLSVTASASTCTTTAVAASVAATATDITTNKTQVVNIGEGKNAVFATTEVPAC